MKKLKPLTELTLAELWKEVKVTEEEIWGDLKLEAQLFLKRILEGAMEDEVMEYIGISRRYERSSNRITHRNGYYRRDLEDGGQPLKFEFILKIFIFNRFSYILESVGCPHGFMRVKSILTN